MPATCGNRSAISPGTAAAAGASRARSQPGWSAVDGAARAGAVRPRDAAIDQGLVQAPARRRDRPARRRAGFESTETEIRGPHESLFLFSGVRGNASALKSIEGVTTFWGDEAQAFSQASVDTIIPTIRAKGSRLIWTWNPDLETDPVDNLFRGNAAGPGTDWRTSGRRRSRSCARSITRESVVSRRAAGRDGVRPRRDFDKYAACLARPVPPQQRGAGVPQLARRGVRERCAAEYRQGADFGFSIDPSCLVRCYIKAGSSSSITRHGGWASRSTTCPNCSARSRMPRSGGRPRTVAAGDDQPFAQHGFPRMRPAIKGARSVEEGVEFLKSYDIVCVHHPRCQQPDRRS
jgi:phage terminase large subunit